MARPGKQGVDYFPLDVHMCEKIKFIKAKFKWEGFGIIISLFQHIYKTGYWCRWTDDDALLYADENRISLNTLNSIVEEALNRRIFDRETYNKHLILTSKGIQKRYREIVKRRRHVEIKKEYQIIPKIWDNKQGGISMPTSCQHDDGNNKENESNKRVIARNNSKNASKFQQTETETETETEKKIKDTSQRILISKSAERPFGKLLTGKEKPFEKILREIWNLYQPQDENFKNQMLGFIQSAKALEIEEKLIVSTIQAQDLDRARKALSFVLEMKAKLEKEGQPIKNINGFYATAWKRKQTSNKADKAIALEIKQEREEEKREERKTREDEENFDMSRKEAAANLGAIFNNAEIMKAANYQKRLAAR